MKTKLIVTMIACLAGAILHADIVELSEGTQYSDLTGGWPKSIFEEGRVIPYYGTDGELHEVHGWLGGNGGGTLYDTDLFALDPTSIANLWWDFGDSGYSLHYIMVNDGQESCKIYLLNGKFDPFAGNLDLSAFYGARIQTLALCGKLPGGEGMPDNGSTIFLLAGTIIPLLRKGRQ